MTSIYELLELSTAHLPAALADRLGAVPGVAACATTYGWLMWVPNDTTTTEQTGSAVLRAIQRYARSQGCDLVLFDRDGDTVDALPTWNW